MWVFNRQQRPFRSALITWDNKSFSSLSHVMIKRSCDCNAPELSLRAFCSWALKVKKPEAGVLFPPVLASDASGAPWRSNAARAAKRGSAPPAFKWSRRGCARNPDDDNLSASGDFWLPLALRTCDSNRSKCMLVHLVEETQRSKPFIIKLSFSKSPAASYFARSLKEKSVSRQHLLQEKNSVNILSNAAIAALYSAAQSRTSNSQMIPAPML